MLLCITGSLYLSKPFGMLIKVIVLFSIPGTWNILTILFVISCLQENHCFWNGLWYVVKFDCLTNIIFLMPNYLIILTKIHVSKLVFLLLFTLISIRHNFYTDYVYSSAQMNTIPAFGPNGSCRPYLQIFKNAKLVFSSTWQSKIVKYTFYTDMIYIMCFVCQYKVRSSLTRSICFSFCIYRPFWVFLCYFRLCFFYVFRL